MSHLDDDIGRLTHQLRQDAQRVYNIWMMQPGRRDEYGERELQDIQDVALAITVLSREIRRLQKREAA